MNLEKIDFTFIENEFIRNFFIKVCEILIEKDDRLIFRDNAGSAFGLSYPNKKFLTYFTKRNTFKFYNRIYKFDSENVDFQEILDEVKAFDIYLYIQETTQSMYIDDSSNTFEWFYQALYTSLEKLKAYFTTTKNNIIINEITVNDIGLRNALLSENILDFKALSTMRVSDLAKIPSFGVKYFQILIEIINEFLSENFTEEIQTEHNDYISQTSYEKLLIKHLQQPSSNCLEEFCMVKANMLYDQILNFVQDMHGEDSRTYRIVYLMIVEEKNLQEIGDEFGLSRERIRQSNLKVYRELKKDKKLIYSLISLESNLFHVLNYIKYYKKGLYKFISTLEPNIKPYLNTKKEETKAHEISNIEMIKIIIDGYKYLLGNNKKIFIKKYIHYLLGQDNIDNLSVYFGVLQYTTYNKIDFLIDVLLYNDIFAMHKSVLILGTNESKEITENDIEKFVYINKNKIKIENLPVDIELLNLLKRKRYNLIKTNGNYINYIYTNEKLDALSKVKPKSVDEFISIEGLSVKAYLSTGYEFVEIIKKYLE